MSERIVRRSGMSFARGLTIDLVLTPADTETLYKLWNGEAWGDPIGFQGGQSAITCEMVAAVPLDQMVKVYGKAFALRVQDIANKNSIV